MAEQISILHMEVNSQFDGIPLSVHFAPPEQAVHPLKPFSIKTQYLFQGDSTICMIIMLMVLFLISL